MKKVKIDDQLCRLLGKSVLDQNKCDDLILQGADVNFITVHGISLITFFSGSGSVESVKYLLSRGASQSIDNQGVKISAVMLAGLNDHKEIIDLLLSYNPKAIKELNSIPLEDLKSKLMSNIKGIDFFLYLYKSYSDYNLPEKFMLTVFKYYQLTKESNIAQIETFTANYRMENPSEDLSNEEILNIYIDGIIILKKCKYLKALISEEFSKKLRLFKLLTLSYIEKGMLVPKDEKLNALVKTRYLRALSDYWNRSNKWLKSVFLMFCYLNKPHSPYRLPVELVEIILSMLMVNFSKGKLHLTDMRTGVVESVYMVNEVSFSSCTKGLPKHFERLALLQSWGLGKR